MNGNGNAGDGEGLLGGRGMEVTSTTTASYVAPSDGDPRQGTDPSQVVLHEQRVSVLQSVQTNADFAKIYPSLPLECRALAEQYVVRSDEIRKMDKIGEGVVGNIYRARWRGLDIALKELKEGFQKGSLQHQDFIKDLNIWCHLRHPNLTTFLGFRPSALLAINLYLPSDSKRRFTPFWWPLTDFSFDEYARLVTDAQQPALLCELLDGGSLESLFIQSRPSPTMIATAYLAVKRKERDGRDWLPSRRTQHSWSLQMARGLCYLHESNPPIVHRDLKPANVLVTGDLRVLKITDFGLARALPRGAYNMTGCTGTKRYMAPEVFLKKPDYGTAVDIYSAAMIMFQILSGRRPLESLQPQEIATRAAPPEMLRPSLHGLNWLTMKDLLIQMWDGRAEHRPSAREVVEALERMQRVPPKPKEVSCSCFGLDCMISCVRPGLAK